MNFSPSIFVIISMLFGSCKPNNVQGHKIVRTENLLLQIQITVIDDFSYKILPPAKGRASTKIDVLISKLPSNKRKLFDGVKLIDAWGNSFCASLEKDEISVWSLGPNGINDHGMDDDIVMKSGDD